MTAAAVATTGVTHQATGTTFSHWIKEFIRKKQTKLSSTQTHSSRTSKGKVNTRAT